MITPTQQKLLEAAATRPDGAIHPLPANIRGGSEKKVIGSLTAKGWIGPGGLPDGDASLPLRITAAGRTAIGLVPDQEHFPAEDADQLTDNPLVETAPPAQEKPQPVRANTKQAMMIRMLHRGATLDQLAAATGWRLHSVRGLISAVIRKRLGLRVISEKNQEGNRVYTIPTD